MIVVYDNIFSSSAIFYHIKEVFDIRTKYVLAASKRAKENLTKSGSNIKAYFQK